MSYGTITSGGDIDTTSAFSNDFSVSKTGTGTYVITFLEWMGCKPALTITPINSSPTDGYSAVYTIPTTSGRYQATVQMYHSTSRADVSFSFESRGGHALTFTAPTSLTLTPSVITFEGTPVLVLSATINLKINGTLQLFHTYLDKGTSLLGVGTSMKLSLSTTTVTSGNNTWTLTGYTYSGGTATTGTAWEGANAASTTLSIGTGGPITTPELFVIKGKPVNSGPTLSTDPLVRLTSVPPAGLAM